MAGIDGAGISGIGQIAITVADLPPAIAFYRDVLGLRFLFEAPPGLAFFDCGGVRLMLTIPEGGSDTRSSVVYYRVGDAEQAARALETRGATIESPPHVVARLATADLWMAFLRDPDGHLLGIMSEVARP